MGYLVVGLLGMVGGGAIVYLYMAKIKKAVATVATDVAKKVS
jgi:hypothetical protein